METLPLLIRNFVFVFILVYLVVGSASFINVLRYNYKTNTQNKALQNLVLEGKLLMKQKELYYLKQQIHPHFLFNSLNTIYAASLKKSEDTPELVLKLSNLLDYVLHQIEKPWVSMEDEVQYIESYIGLESIRFKETLRVAFTKYIEVEKEVPPMLFMAFIENAFTHGGRRNDILDIVIHLSVKEDTMLFEIENSVSDVTSNLESHGLGILNTTKRLNTVYPESYSLHTEQSETSYKVKLEVYFNTHEND